MAGSEFLTTKLRKAFAFLDVDKDGFHTKEDYRQLARNISRLTECSQAEQEHTEKEWVKWFELIMGETTVQNMDVEKFVAESLELLKDPDQHIQLNRNTYGALFERFDFDNDGTLSLNELRLFYQCFGVENENFIHRVFQVLEKDKEGFIRKESFVEGFVVFWTHKESSQYDILHDPSCDLHMI